MVTSGENSDPSNSPAGFTPPEGFALVTQAEHDRNAAELRRLRKMQADREKADADATAERARREAEATGNYQAALQAEAARRQLAEDQARQLAQKDALREAIMLKGYAGEQAAAIVRLANVSTIPVDSSGNADTGAAAAAVDGVLQQFSNLFKQGGAPVPNPTNPNPAQPRSAPAAPARQEPIPTGFLSMEEYLATPVEVRMTPEFQKRVTLSQARWPKEVPATSFAQES